MVTGKTRKYFTQQHKQILKKLQFLTDCQVHKHENKCHHFFCNFKYLLQIAFGKINFEFINRPKLLPNQKFSSMLVYDYESE